MWKKPMPERMVSFLVIVCCSTTELLQKNHWTLAQCLFRWSIFIVVNFCFYIVDTRRRMKLLEWKWILEWIQNWNWYRYLYEAHETHWPRITQSSVCGCATVWVCVYVYWRWLCTGVNACLCYMVRAVVVWCVYTDCCGDNRYFPYIFNVCAYAIHCKEDDWIASITPLDKYSMHLFHCGMERLGVVLD